MAEYIARISYGKDSLKMLDVIWTRGLPLDRITTTDVWATDTISANLPEMDAFKAKMDKRIKELYGIDVEHLCARNHDGSKKTYEQMFYHIPVRRSQIGNVERERERERESRFRPGTIRGFPDLWNRWCQSDLKRITGLQNARNNHRIPTKHPVQLVPKTQNSIRGLGSRDGHCPTNVCSGANISRHGYQRISDKTPFLLSAASQRAKTEILWSTSA
jgi:hypothetical protein